jgi:hypothetical protein
LRKVIYKAKNNDEKKMMDEKKENSPGEYKNNSERDLTDVRISSLHHSSFIIHH